MTIVIRSRETWVGGALRPRFRSETGLREWIAAEDWTPQSGMTKKRMQGAVHSLDGFTESCVRDAIRLAIACFESAASVERATAEQKCCAWQFINITILLTLRRTL